MTKFKLLLATVAVAVAAPALAEPFQFERDGLHFEGEKIVKGDSYVLTGRSIEDNKPFYLRVANGRVRGTMGASSVSFALEEARGATMLASAN
ncbi:hypothetical protein PQ455_14415 [Sphingomonas naphthae]|uniref:Uncharacterized protein n=1 Tax=Sphingomonas naphthae TaxID=1813468 RepID=A0ABY7TK97_9SPHN|nr:hypothetical protein [Sphingomonas naphthae]WCT72820.1 hypothetical protein PQ455_14415 [Sphingomonas naphthae]